MIPLQEALTMQLDEVQRRFFLLNHVEIHEKLFISYDP